MTSNNNSVIAQIEKCPLCDANVNIAQAIQYRTKCMHNQMPLLRYQCPSCGVVYGDRKMLNLTAEQLGKEYVDHYSNGGKEADSTQIEMETLYALAERTQRHAGTYLNWGAGIWSSTLDRAEAEGYRLYGYDPHTDSKDARMLKPHQIPHIKFDGIFSNNLIEHLRYPIATLKEMKGYLRDKESKMVHTTSCYYYLHEYTRFHLFFFLGDSARIMADRAGFHLSALPHNYMRLYTQKI